MAEKEAEQGKRSKLSSPTRPTITLPPRPAIDGLFSSGLGLSPGPMTLVSAFFADPDSTDHRSFSQLLAGAMASPGARLPYNSMDGSFMGMGFKEGGEKTPGFKQSRPLNLAVAARSPLLTVPPGLSPSGLLNSPGFFCLSPQSPFGISHQQALAQVTAQAALAQEIVRAQAEYETLSTTARSEPLVCHPSFSPEETSQQMPPSASEPQSSAMEYSEALQSDRRSQPSGAVDKPAEDGYNWRKYGQKPIKGCEYPRSYYKCTHLNCPVKKKVERSAEGQITEIVYKGTHNHEKPQPNKQTKGEGDGNANLLANLELGSQSLNKLSETVTVHSVHGKNHESAQVATELPGSSDREEGCDEQNREEREDDERNPKRKNIAGEAAVVLSQKTVAEPKIILQTRSEVDLIDDGYRWRKYGQKVVKGNPHPRSYYKCTSAGCNVRKHLERASTDPKAVITTYEGKHNHDIPAARNSSHNTANNSLLQPKPQKVVAEKHPLLQETNYRSNGQGPAVLRLKE